MVAVAPRYDPRLRRALRTLDDPRQPIAETCRRAGDLAWRLGLTRPSYVHVRRLVLAERGRRAAVRALVDGLATRARAAPAAAVPARRRAPFLVVPLWPGAVAVLRLRTGAPARDGPRP